MYYPSSSSCTASKRRSSGRILAIAGMAYLFMIVCVEAQTLKSFSLKDVSTGKMVALSDFNKDKGLIVIFSSNDCPYDNYYVERVRSLIRENAGALPVVLVNAHAQQEENESSMKSRLERTPFNVPYLADKEQQLMSGLGATKSPEAFLLRNEKGNFSVVYHGAIDDNPQVATDVDHAWLHDAIRQFVAGQAPAVTETRPVGCSIRKR